MRTIVLDRRYAAPSRLVAEYMADPVRMFIIAGLVFAFGYGAREENNSPFTFMFLEPIVGNAFSLIEVLLITVTGLELIRRIAIGDYWIERSPVSRSVIVVGVVCCLYPLLHMMIAEGSLRLPLEILSMPVFIVMFFAYLFLFRRTELPMMIWMVIAAGVYKLVEGVAIYAEWGISWGLLTGWRDGLLLSMLAIGGVLALIIRDGGDRTYARIRRVLIWLLPVATAVFMGSMRRTYMLGIVLSLPLIVYLLRGRERRVAIVMSGCFVVAAAGIILFMGMGFGERVTSAVSDPATEGSSAYRLIELYNVGLMIQERPLTGWPMATVTQNSTGIEFENVSELIPHNVYMYTMVRAGIWGLIAWCAMLYAIVRMNLRTVRAARRPLERFAALWLLSTTVCIVAAGFTSPVIADRLQLFLAFPFVMASFLPGAWPGRRAAAVVA